MPSILGEEPEGVAAGVWGTERGAGGWLMVCVCGNSLVDGG